MIIELGMIAGRHEMPVEKYLFGENEIDGICFSFNELRKEVSKRLESILKPSSDYIGLAINQSSVSDIEVFGCENSLVLYVTGFSPVLAEIISFCAYNGAALTLMHYNPSTGEYVPQNIFNKTYV